MNEQSCASKERFTIHRHINPQYDDDVSDESSDAERRTEHKRWQKQPTVVAKRNARERTRVHTVNQAFVTLKFHLPSLRAHTKRVSKLKILNAAISYIDSLVAILKNYDANVAAITLPTDRRHRTAQ
ncbi:Helix-loop-helix DNA-binding domain protein, partial [Ostertagia ostertagi]